MLYTTVRSFQSFFSLYIGWICLWLFIATPCSTQLVLYTVRSYQSYHPISAVYCLKLPAILFSSHKLHLPMDFYTYSLLYPISAVYCWKIAKLPPNQCFILFTYLYPQCQYHVLLLKLLQLYVHLPCSTFPHPQVHVHVYFTNCNHTSPMYS